MTSGLHERLQSALGGAYTVERELGGGGMSRVFVANETALGRRVVIKIVSSDLLEGVSVERFAREVRVAARLQHANIVPVLTSGDAGGVPYYTMPFVRGESLRARIAAGAPVPFADAIHVLRDVARALAFAHGEGVVHRDIKPENILLAGGAAMVTDFGIAKAIDASKTQDAGHTGSTGMLTRTGTSLGTPAYMAPEQAAGDPGVDLRADIYAWGMIAWELLAGRHPFADKPSLQAVLAAQMTEVPAPLASVRPDVPVVMSDLVSRCLEKEAARRPSSAAELLATLDQAVSTGSRAAATPEPSRAKRTLRRLVIAATAGVLVLLGAWLVKSRFGRVTATSGAAKSLAVIPFTSSPGDTASAYLAEGIADEVTNTLSKVPGLRLAGRTSAGRLSGKSAREVGATLGVGAVLDGEVRRSGDRIRVSVELSNASDGLVAWHENYERAAADVFAVQDEIARAIAGQLQVNFAGAGANVARGTSDPAAYDLYLKGMYLYRRRGPEIAAAIAALEQATVRDSNFARAWAALSNALTVSPSYVPTRMGAVLPRARAAAERAVRLDPKLSEAHLALGYAHAEAFEWPEAEAELHTAIALDSTAAEPRYRLGYTLMNQGRAAEAIPVLQEAVARDPLYFIATAYLGWAELESGRVAEGLEQERAGLALEPNNISALTIFTNGFVSAGVADSAKFYARRILSVSTAPARMGVAASALARTGDADEARAVVKRIEATPPDTWTRWTGLSLAYIGLRDWSRAIDAMQHAAAGDGDALPLYILRGLGDLPADPRVDAVLRRYRLDPKRFERPAGAGSGEEVKVSTAGGIDPVRSPNGREVFFVAGAGSGESSAPVKPVDDLPPRHRRAVFSRISRSQLCTMTVCDAAPARFSSRNLPSDATS